MIFQDKSGRFLKSEQEVLPATERRVKLVPRVLRPRRADHDQPIVKSLPVGPMTKSAPGCSSVPVINPRTGAPMTFSEARDLSVLKKSDPSGKHQALQVGSVVHFETGGRLLHGKILSWGRDGATVIERHGDVAEVPWSKLNIGRHPGAKESQDDAEVRRVRYSIDDLLAGQFVTFLATDDQGQPYHQVAQIVNLGALVEIEMRGGKRLRLRYDQIEQAGWDRP